ncbi:Mcm10 replication factor-domain-containing protein [Paraphysoderma sedebokerense]|nr:Mcm10 replication factor-domain-containing protein [Paraphysoderma sedebokerense]
MLLRNVQQKAEPRQANSMSSMNPSASPKSEKDLLKSSFEKEIKISNDRSPFAASESCQNPSSNSGANLPTSEIETSAKDALKHLFKDAFKDSVKSFSSLSDVLPATTKSNTNAKTLFKHSRVKAKEEEKVLAAPKSKGFALDKMKKISCTFRDENVARNFSSSQAPKSVIKQNDSDVTESYSGFRLKQRLISSAALSTLMERRQAVKLKRLPGLIRLKDDIPGDWVVFGIIADKSPPRTSSRGDKFCIVRLTDLIDDTVNLFCFRGASDAITKWPSGTVVGVLNPKVSRPTEKHSALGLTIDNPEKLLNIGSSLDIGYCHGRKKDGANCNKLIDKRNGDYCDYHVVSAFKKSKTKRMEFAISTNPLYMKSQKSLQPETAIAPDSKYSKDNGTYIIDGKPISTVGGKIIGNTGDSKKRMEYVITTVKSCNSIGAQYLRDTKGVKFQEERSKYKEDDSKQQLQRKKLASDALKSLLTCRPKSAGGQGEANEAARQRALEKIATNKVQLKPQNTDKEIPKVIEKVTDEDLKARKEKARLLEAERKRKREYEDGFNGTTDSSPTDPRKIAKKAKADILASKFGLDLSSAETQALISTKSAHSAAALEAEFEELASYLDEMERKDKLMTRMDQITSLKVKVYKCKECGYVAEKCHEICVRKHHRVDKIEVMKKWWECTGCKGKTYTLRESYPKSACSRCKSTSFKRSSMLKVCITI